MRLVSERGEPSWRGRHPYVDRARPGEGDSIARMIRLSLPGNLRSLTIWASPTAGRYVESMLVRRQFAHRDVCSGPHGSCATSHEHYLLRCGLEIIGLA